LKNWAERILIECGQEALAVEFVHLWFHMNSSGLMPPKNVMTSYFLQNFPHCHASRLRICIAVQIRLQNHLIDFFPSVYFGSHNDDLMDGWVTELKSYHMLAWIWCSNPSAMTLSILQDIQILGKQVDSLFLKNILKALVCPASS
jgi:predicted restriction endonuclease